MAEIKLNNDTFTLPDSWDQLTRQQFIELAKLSLLKLPINQFKLQLLLVILNMKVHNKLYVKYEPCYKLTTTAPAAIYLISITDLAYVVSHSLAFLFKESKINDKPHIEIDCKLNKTLIEYIDVNGTKWFGPDNSLSNSIYEEYVRCLIAASEYSRGDSTAIDRLICAMYRPGNSDNKNKGDIRDPFNDHRVPERSLMVKDLHPAIKIAILLQFNGAVRNLAAIFKHAFSGGGFAPATSKDIFMQQFEIIDNLAQHRISEKEQIRKSQLYDVLQTLDNIVKSAPKKKRHK